ncbi:MAG: hypothetical protein LBD78_01110 [Spirochaetaceae bacterium]|jgi:hypothetical protein|nr:hypothetical protein [Spirochaetaceae bacterium]
MRNPVCFLLSFSLLLCGTAAADTFGLRAGFYVDSPDVLADERQYFLTPQLEYKHPFGNFDIYARGEYSFSLTGPYPQFFFAEEKIAFHLPLGSRSEFQVRLHNENALRFNPDWGGGRVKPEVSYGLFLPPGDFSLALGLPLIYPSRGGGNREARFGFDVTAAYITPFRLGFEAAANVIAAPSAVFEGMKFAANYTGDQFYGELAFTAGDSFGYYRLKAEFDYFFNFLILWGALEAGNLANPEAAALAAAVGIKYRF